MTRIAITTDFTVKSLQLVRKAIEHQLQQGVNELDVVLLMGYNLSGSITEQLYFSKSKIAKQLQQQEFVEACHMIKGKYTTTLKSLSFDLLSSNSQAYVKNYLNAQNYSMVYLADSGQWAFPKKQCFDLSPVLKNATAKHVILNWPENKDSQEVSGFNSIADLFFEPNTANLQS